MMMGSQVARSPAQCCSGHDAPRNVRTPWRHQPVALLRGAGPHPAAANGREGRRAWPRPEERGPSSPANEPLHGVIGGLPLAWSGEGAAGPVHGLEVRVAAAMAARHRRPGGIAAEAHHDLGVSKGRAGPCRTPRHRGRPIGPARTRTEHGALGRTRKVWIGQSGVRTWEQMRGGYEADPPRLVLTLVSPGRLATTVPPPPPRSTRHAPAAPPQQPAAQPVSGGPGAPMSNPLRRATWGVELEVRPNSAARRIVVS